MTEAAEETPKERPVEILLVEDNPGDVRLTVEALKEGKVWNTLHIVDDGEKAMSFLRQEGNYVSARRPDLILLDLDLPRKDGRAVLAEIKQDAGLKHIPVIVLTSSEAEQDVLRTYDSHATCYITKPVDLGQLLGIVKKLKGFWLTIIKLPPA